MAPGCGRWKATSGRSQASLPVAWRAGVELAARYLAALWREPNFDLWEEYGDHRHGYTQATIYGGLMAAARLLDRPDWADVAGQVQAELLASAAHYGHFTKFLTDLPAEPGPAVKAEKAREDRSGGPAAHEQTPPAEAQARAVDGALIALALPYGVVPVSDPAYRRTVELIERELQPGRGGVQRYAWDTYYGGGEWVLLAAWLGWYHVAAAAASVEAEAGEGAEPHGRAAAEEVLRWIEGSADDRGDLPEQVPQNLIAPQLYQPWVDKRGPIARPLLWSHAQYLILCAALGELSK